MNQDINKIEVPRKARHKGQKIVRVLQAIVSDNPEESGYLVVLEDGSTATVPTSKLEVN